MIQPRLKSRLLKAGFPAYALALLLVSLLPMDQAAGGPRILVDLHPGVQNLLHAPAFMLLAVLAGLTVKGTGCSRPWLFPGSACIVYGLLLEWLQLFVPGRFVSLLDAGLNCLGVLLGLLLLKALDM